MAVDREVVGTFHEADLLDADGIQQASWACPSVGIPSSWEVPCNGVDGVDDAVVLVESNASCEVEVLGLPWEMELGTFERNLEEEDPCGHSMEHQVACPSRLHQQLAWHSRLHADP